MTNVEKVLVSNWVNSEVENGHSDWFSFPTDTDSLDDYVWLNHIDSLIEVLKDCENESVLINILTKGE